MFLSWFNSWDNYLLLVNNINSKHLRGRCLEMVTHIGYMGSSVPNGGKGRWLHWAVPALLYTPLQHLQVSPQPITGIPEELVTTLVLCWHRRKRRWHRHLGSEITTSFRTLHFALTQSPTALTFEKLRLQHKIYLGPMECLQQLLGWLEALAVCPAQEHKQSTERPEFSI